MILVTLPIVTRTHLQIWKTISIVYRRCDRKKSFTVKFCANLRQAIHVSWSRWRMNVREKTRLKDRVLMMTHSVSLCFSCASRTEEIRFHHGPHPSGWNQLQFHDAWITRVYHIGRQDCQSKALFSAWSHSRSSIFAAITLTTGFQNCADAQSRWSHHWQLSVFSDRQRYEP